NNAGLFVSVADILIQVGRAKVPFGVLVNSLSVKRIREHKLRWSSVRSGYDPSRPCARFCFHARRKAGSKLRPRARAFRTGVDFGKRSNLRPSQTVIAVRSFTGEHCGIEMAGTRVLDEAIFHSVNGVALPENCLLNSGKLGCRDRCFWIV